MGGGTIVQQSANVYETVDASLTVASPVLQVLARVQSKLLRFSNPDSGELTGDLASGWETPDGQTVVMQLRDGVNWHAEGPGAGHRHLYRHRRRPCCRRHRVPDRRAAGRIAAA